MISELEPVGLLVLGLAAALTPDWDGWGEWLAAVCRACVGVGENVPALDGGTMER